jgi:hypothetical protein
MSVFKELNDIVETQMALNGMTNDILDVYKKNPKECERLLIELDNINKELDELETEFLKFI